MTTRPDDQLPDRIVLDALRREPPITLRPDFADRVARRAIPWRPGIPWLELLIVALACAGAWALLSSPAWSRIALDAPFVARAREAVVAFRLDLVGAVVVSLVLVALLDRVARPRRLRGIG